MVRDELEFAQVMSIAEGILSGVKLHIGLPVVMHRCADRLSAACCTCVASSAHRSRWLPAIAAVLRQLVLQLLDLCGLLGHLLLQLPHHWLQSLDDAYQASLIQFRQLFAVEVCHDASNYTSYSPALAYGWLALA